MKVHPEIEYPDIHSDICPENCEAENLNNPIYQKYLHECLQEWLDKSNGEGISYIAEEGYIKKQLEKGSFV